MKPFTTLLDLAKHIVKQADNNKPLHPFLIVESLRHVIPMEDIKKKILA